MSVGKRPLQGTRQFVTMATSRSRGESMMRQPVTPAALQPKPMHIVRACFPWQPALRKQLSRSKAMRGRKPASSKSVNSGKKMAIGGSMTATTHATVRYIPSASAPRSHGDTPSEPSSAEKGSCSENSHLESRAEGAFAPSIVSQKTKKRKPSKIGMPVRFEVSTLSIARSRAALSGPCRTVSAAMSAQRRSVRETSSRMSASASQPASASAARARPSAVFTSGAARMSPAPCARRGGARLRSPSSSRSATQRAGTLPPSFSSSAGTSSPAAVSAAAPHSSRKGVVRVLPAATSATARSSASSPAPLRALVPTTGMPSRRDKAARSTRMPFFAASSRRFTHKTARSVTSRICSVRLRFRSRQVASATMRMASAPPKQRKSRAMPSSGELASRE